jgi:hypothetical protein
LSAALPGALSSASALSSAHAQVSRAVGPTVVLVHGAFANGFRDDGHSTNVTPANYPQPACVPRLIADSAGFVTLPEDAVLNDFAQDLSPAKARVIAATQGPLRASALDGTVSLGRLARSSDLVCRRRSSSKLFPIAFDWFSAASTTTAARSCSLGRPVIAIVVVSAAAVATRHFLHAGLALCHRRGRR